MSLDELRLLLPEVAVAVGALAALGVGMAGAPQRVVTGVGLAGLAVALSIVVIGYAGGASDTYGTTIVLDRFAHYFKALVAVAAGLTLLASGRAADRFPDRGPEYTALILLAAAGMMLLPSGINLIMIYVALELATLPLVALAAFGGGRTGAEAGIKYLALSAVASALLLYGMALTYGYTGSVALADIAEVAQGAAGGDAPFGAPIFAAGIALMLAGFGFKMAVVPFHGWAPDVYQGAPTPVTAFLSVASKAVAFGVVLRVFLTAFGAMEADWALLFAGLAAASMTLGNLAALAQSTIKRMLAYSAIAHAGYLLVGLAAVASRTSDGVTSGPEAALFYLAGYGATSMAAFLAAMALAERAGSEDIGALAGAGRRAPWHAAGLTVALLSLTGIPPTVGFMAKLFVFGAAVNADLAWLAVLAAVNSVVSAYYYLRVVRTMYLNESAEADGVTARALGLDIAVAVAAVATVALGVWPEPLYRAAQMAVEGLR